MIWPSLHVVRLPTTRNKSRLGSFRRNVVVPQVRHDEGLSANMSESTEGEDIDKEERVGRGSSKMV